MQRDCVGSFGSAESRRRARAPQDANQAGFGADWARRNLDDDLGQKHAVMASMSMHQAPIMIVQRVHAHSTYANGERERDTGRDV